MFYSIHGKNLSAALVTEDGIVLDATENLVWTRGKRISMVLGWAKRHRMCWSVSATLPPGLVVHEGSAYRVH